MSLELVFDLASIIQFQRVLPFGFLEDQTRRVGLSGFGLIFFVKSLEFRFDQLEALLDRIDLASHGFGSIIQTYDLLGLISVFAFRAIALESIVGVAATDLSQRLFDKSSMLRRIAKRFFLCDHLFGELLLQVDRFGKTFFEAFDG
jgi:hypothetical protein